MEVIRCPFRYRLQDRKVRRVGVRRSRKSRKTDAREKKRVGGNEMLLFLLLFPYKRDEIRGKNYMLLLTHTSGRRNRKISSLCL